MIHGFFHPEIFCGANFRVNICTISVLQRFHCQGQPLLLGVDPASLEWAKLWWCIYPACPTYP